MAETTTVAGGGGRSRAVAGGTRSALVYTVTTGARGGRTSFATRSSGGAGYSDKGCRYAMTSAVSIARSAAARIASCRRYSGSSRPGESVKMNCVSPRVSRPTTGRRVDCGLGETIARRSPIKAFKRVDLPTLGRPARTTVPHFVIGRQATDPTPSRQARMGRVARFRLRPEVRDDTTNAGSRLPARRVRGAFRLEPVAAGRRHPARRGRRVWAGHHGRVGRRGAVHTGAAGARDRAARGTRRRHRADRAAGG